MGKLGEEAKDYEPPQTKNISELEKVSVDIELEDRTGTTKEGRTFYYKVFVRDGEDYRVPNSVLKAVKVIL